MRTRAETVEAESAVSSTTGESVTTACAAYAEAVASVVGATADKSVAGGDSRLRDAAADGMCCNSSFVSDTGDAAGSATEGGGETGTRSEADADVAEGKGRTQEAGGTSEDMQPLGIAEATGGSGMAANAAGAGTCQPARSW